MIEIKNETEKVILVGVSLSDQDDTKESLEELKDLVSTAGAETVGMVIQNREQQHPGTYVGKGKIEELKSGSLGRQESYVMMNFLRHR